MYKLINLKRDHMLRVLASPLNDHCRHIFTEKVIANAVNQDFGIAIIVNGDVMAVGGVNYQWANRGTVWGLFSGESKDCFLPVFRAVKKWLDLLPYSRLEVDVPFGDKKILRRAKLWGFEVEAERARKYSIMGEDCTLLARIK